MHRRDIDGLRAVAVGAVIANHFSESVLPGGHLGVDIFFVISGFVITLSLQRQPDTSARALLAAFYQRRIRRILPALLACVLLSAPLFALFDPKPELTLMTGASALFGLSNFYLLGAESDYFSFGTKFNGFTHTWSLGIEEQFYLIYPALFWLLLRGERRARVILAGLIAVSFAGFVLASRADPVAAFYLLPFRAWELAVGALLARVQPEARSGLAGIGSWGGAALLCASLAMPASAAVLGPLMAVAGSAALIHFGGSAGPVDRFLLLPTLQWIGKISYSLYLWHWPVLALSRWTVGIRWWLAPLQLVLMFAVAAASYRWVEQRFRKPRAGERPFATIAIGLAPAAALALGLHLVAILPPEHALFAGQPVKLAEQGPESLEAPFALEGHGRWLGKPCIFATNGEATRRVEPRDCALGSERARRRALVIGNSFAAAFVAGFAPLVRDHGHSVTLFSSWAASPTPSIRNDTSWSAANAAMWQRVYPQLLEPLAEGDSVILASDLFMVAPEHETRETREAQRHFSEDLTRMSAQLRSRGIRLIVMHSLPFFHGKSCKVELGIDQWFTPFGSPCNFLSRSDQLKRREPVDRILHEHRSKGEIVVVDFFDLFCPDEICDYTREDVGLIYRDQNGHPALETMPLVGAALVDQLRKGGVLAAR